MISIWLANEWIQAKQNYKRVNQSFANSKKELVKYRTVNDKLAAKVDVLQFRNAEIEKIYPEILEEIENLKIKDQRVTQYSESVLHYDIDIATDLKDSVDKDSVKLHTFDYKNEFYAIKGEIKEDSINLNISSTDSIIQVIYKGERKKPWLWFLSKRKLEQVIYSKNPNSEILYSRSIEIINRND